MGNLFKKSNLHKLSALVDKAEKVDDVIRRHCANHQCCEQDDKSQVTDDILSEITGLNKYTGDHYEQCSDFVLRLRYADEAMDSIKIRDILDEIKFYFHKQKKDAMS